MSLTLVKTIEPDGTLRYGCGPDVVVRVQLHRRNGTKKCPVELLHQNTSVIATDSNLRELRDIESLLKHATTRCPGVDWHDVLTEIAKALPPKAEMPWTPVAKGLDGYIVQRKDYLWYPGFPKGEPVSLEGDPGAGKSALLIKIVCHITRGHAFPTLFLDHPEHDFPPSNVVLFTYEDDPGSTIHPRVLINGGDPARVQIMEGKRNPHTGDVCPMTLQDLPLIATLLKDYTPALMAFDPIQSFLGPHVDMNHAADTRPILDAVRNLCKSAGCTPLYIRHNGKAQRTKALHTALGSIDIAANMRSALSLYTDPEDPQRRILAQTKSNGRRAPSMQLKLVGTTYDVPIEAQQFLTVEDVRVDWDGKSDLTAEDLNARECAHGNDPQEAQSALDQARDFLREVLRNGPVLTDEVFAQAKQAGITIATLRRAKAKERVKAKKEATDGSSYTKSQWSWHPPDDTQG